MKTFSGEWTPPPEKPGEEGVDYHEAIKKARSELLGKLGGRQDPYYLIYRGVAIYPQHHEDGRWGCVLIPDAVHPVMSVSANSEEAVLQLAKEAIDHARGGQA